MIILPIFLQLIVLVLCDSSYKKSSIINERKESAKFDNPNFVRDRLKNEIDKPQMPDIFKERNRKPFNPAWMDYCDAYHCNDYHRTACGLNRATMRFKWFQSVCHIILNNQCHTYRGALQYDVVDNKFCVIYVMHLRAGCPAVCETNDDEEPVCAVSSHSNEVVLFKSRCAMDKENCKKELQEIEEVNMNLCEYYIAGEKFI